MYKKSEKQMSFNDKYLLSVREKSSSEKRWHKLAAVIPWDDTEDSHAENHYNTTGVSGIKFDQHHL